MLNNPANFKQCLEKYTAQITQISRKSENSDSGYLFCANNLHTINAFALTTSVLKTSSNFLHR